MKKLISALLVVFMVAALSVSAFAFDIDSPTVTIDAEQGTVSELDHSILPAINWTSTDAVTEFVEATGLTGTVANPEGLAYSWAFDYTPSDSVKSGDTVTFYDANIKAGKRVVVLHYNGTAWEQILDTTAVKDGEISFTYMAASPYAILVESNGSQSGTEPTNGNGSQQTNGGTQTNGSSQTNNAAKTNGTSQPSGTAQATGTQSSAVKSDKTGDMPYELFLLGGMMFFGAVTVITLKRREG